MKLLGSEMVLPFVFPGLLLFPDSLLGLLLGFNEDIFFFFFASWSAKLVEKWILVQYAEVSLFDGII